MLDVKKGGRVRIRAGMVEFIALSFPVSSKINFWPFHVVVVCRDGKEIGDARAELLFCSLNLLLLWRSRCRCRRIFITPGVTDHASEILGLPTEIYRRQFQVVVLFANHNTDSFIVIFTFRGGSWSEEVYRTIKESQRKKVECRRYCKYGHRWELVLLPRPHKHGFSGT